eukprot:g33357.t1
MGNKEMMEELNGYLALVFTVEDTSSIPELQDSQWAEKGERQKTGNYRAVSLISVVGHILESFIKDVIVDYLEAHCKIELSQHGFIKGSGVPQEPMLGPQLFMLYVNNLDKGTADIAANFAEDTKLDEITEDILAKFADDTKIVRGTDSFEEVGRLQKDLDKLEECAKKWQMEYNVGKCAVMHFGKKNKCMDYFLNGEKIQKSEVLSNLGVLVQDSLK